MQSFRCCRYAERERKRFKRSTVGWLVHCSKFKAFHYSLLRTLHSRKYSSGICEGSLARHSLQNMNVNSIQCSVDVSGSVFVIFVLLVLNIIHRAKINYRFVLREIDGQKRKMKNCV